MTNRELLQRALPLKSLTEKEWNLLSDHIVKVSKDYDLMKVLEKLKTNQARVEVMGNYIEYYFDLLDEPVSNNCTDIQIA